MTFVSRAAAFLKNNASPTVFGATKAVYNTLFRPEKYSGELNFWRMQYLREGGVLTNGKYETIMLQMAKPLTIDDLSGKVVCDFGCGPRGTLTWLSSRSHCVGIDVLSDRYYDTFPEVIANNNMTYIKCHEDFIPMQSEVVDVLFTMNALDHVKYLDTTCGEIARILKPGGYLIGSFNLYEEETVTEPQTLDEGILNKLLFVHFDQLNVRLAPKFEVDFYDGFFDRPVPPNYSGPMILWYVGRKKL
ncbi:Ubiquinone biosynthesis O-methyltransferase [Pseudorhizobium halotolerans]|uniref:Ubiquinone biosynthesis O-methyltransferase n=1 Tax=Pseudorhizobium halotolerans TaxID=1233081 RepID=A0ABM8PFF1_9HYPH|nr:class I SAM-dependent methyltransferase [Pseudorhizobium halotolerans]CAD7026905.1 Ubiquinone biosynthesis O-methyltransferase [Pseudorhizobium halotolerans]